MSPLHQAEPTGNINRSEKTTMRKSDFLLHLNLDRVYVELFCQKYQAQVIDVLPNTEDFPPRGLMYIFDNQPGGFSIQGVKNSLEDNFKDDISEPR